MTDFQSVQERIESEGIEFVDFRVVDLVGRFRHITIPAARFDERTTTKGIGFDGSNYGYRKIAGSDMVLIPDLSSAYVEERSGERILTVIGDVCDAESRCPAAIAPRGIGRRASAYLSDTGIADEAIVSPEFEFYIFEEALFESGTGRICVDIVPLEGREHRERPGVKTSEASAYHSPLPQDQLFGLRNEISRQLESAGIPVKYHHHEVGIYGQQEIEIGFATLLRMADVTLIAKSIVQNVVAEAGLSATFLPKPLYCEAGNGMHLHQFLRKGGKNLFAGSGGLSELARCYVGGLLTHGRSLMAFTNPSTNSYRRLVPGYEAPVHLVYGAANRSAAIRVPAYASEEETRIELRTMDATANPYLAYAAILLAGIDGIQRGLDANKLGMGPYDNSLYGEKMDGCDTPRSLEEALDALGEDHEYLLRGGVFAEEEIEHWISVKTLEQAAVALRPHPHEFTLYYDL